MEMQSECLYLNNPQTQQDMKDNAIERWRELLLVHGSNQAKYVTLTKGFVSYYYLGNGQYPRYIMTATDALSNQKK